MSASDALPFPLKNAAYRVTFPLLDGDGDLVEGATGLDSEASKDGATFANCTNEATEILTIVHDVNDTTNAVTAADATDQTSLNTLLNEIKADYNAHRVSTTFHDAADSTNAVTSADATDAATSVTLANEIKTDYNAHRSQADVHPHDDSANAVSSADATNEATCITLANEIKTDYNAHLTGTAGSGMAYLDLTSTEMNSDTVTLVIKTTTTGAKTTPIVLYPVEDTNIPVNLTAIGGVVQSLTDFKDFADAGYDPLTHKITGTADAITDIITVTPLIPNAIDLAGTLPIRLGFMLTNALGNLPTTAEITPGNIGIDRKPMGGTSWSAVIFPGACSEVDGVIYYDEVFDSGSGYAAGDTIRIMFSGQKVTVGGVDHEISGSWDQRFYTYIREAMVGTDAAALAATALSDVTWTDAKAVFLDHSIDTVDTVADGIQTDLSNATDGLGALKALLDTISGYTDKIDDATNGLSAIKAEVEGLAGAAMRGTNSAALATGVDVTSIHGSALTETVGGYLAAGFTKLFDVATPVLVASDVMVGTDSVPTNPLLTNDARLDNLDTTISSRNATTPLNAAAVKAEAVAALSDIKLDHLLNIAVDTNWATTVHLNSVIGHMADVGTVATFDRITDALEAIRVRGDSAWVTGGGGAINDILNIQTLIPFSIDLANTATVRIGLGLTNMVDDLPTTAEITPGTITIDRKAIGGTSWVNKVNAAACLEAAGLIYYDEVFDTVTGYVAGDSIRITFKSQKITVDANDFEITGADGWVFQTHIREAMVGTDSAALAATALSDATWTDAKAVHIDANISSRNATTPPTVIAVREEMDSNSTRLDANVSTRSSHTAANVWAVTTRALTDKAGFSLSTAGIKAIWDQLTSALTTVGSAGKLLVDNINATISSRNATTPPTVGAIRTEMEGVGTKLTAVKDKTDNLPSGIVKNEALPKFDFLMVLSSNHVTGATGKTVTGTISKDGGAFAAIANVITEVSGGVYTIADGFTQTEMNVDVATLMFIADDCDTRVITIITS